MNSNIHGIQKNTLSSFKVFFSRKTSWQPCRLLTATPCPEYLYWMVVAWQTIIRLVHTIYTMCIIAFWEAFRVVDWLWPMIPPSPPPSPPLHSLYGFHSSIAYSSPVVSGPSQGNGSDPMLFCCSHTGGRFSSFVRELLLVIDCRRRRHRHLRVVVASNVRTSHHHHHHQHIESLLRSVPFHHLSIYPTA